LVEGVGGEFGEGVTYNIVPSPLFGERARVRGNLYPFEGSLPKEAKSKGKCREVISLKL